MTKIAFIGVRNMGPPMANNLIKAGHQLCVYDVMPVCMKALPAAKAAASALHSKNGHGRPDFSSIINMVKPQVNYMAG